jgi:signal transduction histidine kinase
MLLHLINDILDMSKFETGKMELTLSPYRPGDMLSDIVGMLWIKAKEKNLAFKVDVSPDLPVELLGDEMRIKQILINVLNNAIKYTSEGSVSLQIQCERNNEDGVLVSYVISDTGMGIKTESIPYRSSICLHMTCWQGTCSPSGLIYFWQDSMVRFRFLSNKRLRCSTGPSLK